MAVDFYIDDESCARFCREFGIPDDRKTERFHFPGQSFLENGYAPPGGYVKDFSIIKRRSRYHLFHIDGRPQERCYLYGNEISFGHASTSDFRHWIRHRMPLAVGVREWESEHIWAPFVYEKNGLFYMFYMGSGKGHKVESIAYAVSQDLEDWTRSDLGPIPGVDGRDPFVFGLDGRTVLVYTGHSDAKPPIGHICATSTEDMVHWEKPRRIFENPGRIDAESSSLHRLDDGRWVLWFGDYLHTDDISGDFRSCYVLSDDPFHFDPRNIRQFDFHVSTPVKYTEEDWIEKKPIPLSLEAVERKGNVWLVSYFRWHIDRFRLFWGRLEWAGDKACVYEITNDIDLQATLRELCICQ